MDFKKIMPKLPHLFREVMDRKLKEKGINVPFPMFLMRLTEKEGVTLSELGNELMFDKAHISRTVAMFEEEGLVEKQPDANDKRILRLYVTPKGRGVAKVIREIHDNMNEMLLNGVSKEDLEVCGKVLKQIYHNLIKETEKKDGLCLNYSNDSNLTRY
jgi:MarR family transcriptional regulator for hemolysin